MKDKRLTPLNAAELGAGIGLLFVCIVCVLLDLEHIEIYLPLSSIGLMMATGVFSAKSGKKCTQKETHNL
jgi:hypothetical protein